MGNSWSFVLKKKKSMYIPKEIIDVLISQARQDAPNETCVTCWVLAVRRATS